MKPLIGTWAGAVFGLLVAIAYNTSAQTAALEGGHSHLAFRGVLFVALAGAALGLILGLATFGPRD